MTTEVVVYGAAGSTYVRSVLFALEAKGISCELRQLPVTAYKEEAYLTGQHPFGKIPAFEHGAFKLYETQAILRYVDDMFDGPALQPSTPERRARMNQLIGIVDAYLYPSAGAGIIWHRLALPSVGLPGDDAAVAAAMPLARRSIAAIGALADGPYLVGNALSLADLMVLPILGYLTVIDEGRQLLAPHPNLRAWIRRLDDRFDAANLPKAA